MSEITQYHNGWLEKYKGQYFETAQIYEYFSNTAVLLSNPQFDSKGSLKGGTIEFVNQDDHIVKIFLATLPAGNYRIENVPSEDFIGLIWDDY